MTTNEPPPYPGQDPQQPTPPPPPPNYGSVPPPPPPPAGGGYPPPGAYPPAPGGYEQPQAPGNQKALWSMILGISALVTSIVCFCVYIAGIVLGVPAVILAVIAKREIEASGGQQSGAGQAKAGLITGIIGIVLSVLTVILLVVLFATGNIDLDYYYYSDL